ncbi:MAG TPA: long-chain fatty acid--CoA ligase [Nevskiaceae bacterium]|nr:long-chain fatty acid--CoA ligase [Nevskiaceae bacterium]
MSTTYLTQALHRAVRIHPQRTATICAARSHSYEQFTTRVARAAGALQKLGMKPGDRVGILALNSDRFLELYFAVWWGGGVVNPVNIRWSAREIAYSLDDCATQILAVDQAFAPLVPELSERSQALRTVLYIGDGAAASGMFEYEALIAEHAPVADAMRCNGDLAGVFYTGGTTGFPKGVMLTHANLSYGASAALISGIAEEDDVGLHAAPMFHMADAMFALALFLRGCTQAIVPMFNPETALAAIAGARVSVALLVPTMIQMLVDHPRLPEFDLASLRRVLYGASPISEALLARAMARLPNAGFIQCYGQTEMSPIVTVLSAADHLEGKRLRSAGRPAVGVEVKIVDADDREVARGTVGEICARGPGVMAGYWNQPEQTAAAIRDGWMHTGDGAYVDGDGYLYVVDRVKDMIVSGGENVYSAEVENAIAQHAAVAMCAVIGIPDEQWGEAVHAVIVCRPGARVGADEIKAHCKALIATYKCPRSVELRDALPLSGAGKVLKNNLREPYWAGRQRRVG